MGSPIVDLAGVAKTFESRAGATEALRAVSLSVDAGEFVSVIGPSGCGKSSLLRIVGDLVEPSAGVVRVKGKSARQARLDRDYGIVFQTPVLYDWRTVLENVQLPLELAGRPRAEREQRPRTLLRLVGLDEFAGHYPWQLSGGMQQRVAIARALALNPSILLMDEPFGALDEMTRERLNQELLQVCAETAATVLFVTHSIAEAVFLSTRIVVMSPRPGGIERVVTVALPRPRVDATRADPRFFELVTTVRQSLREDPGLAGDRAGLRGR
ncbi:MAG: sulfonate ABC transporter ATP-binding protein [Candidatus Rokuibacteriota bacterium]|nr:MAG: sulfonate ABC transporter ATP-binding protein [Candidatus Rokubacteria bacterium]